MLKTIKSIPKPIIALVAVALIASAVYAAVTLGPFPVNLTVNEPLSVTPASIDLTVFAGESTTGTFTVTNAASVTINISVFAVVSSVPFGGSAGDITLTFPASIAATPGANTLAVGIAVSQSAVAGSYTITVTVVR